jgi:hypothetical protein
LKFKVIRSLAILVLCLVASSEPSAQDQATPVTKGVRKLLPGLNLPDRIGPFVKGKIIDNEQSHPGLGLTIAYHGGSIGEGTIYIYDRKMEFVPDGPMAPIVKGEFDMATRNIITVAAAEGHKIELVSRYGTGTPNRGPEFLCAEFKSGQADGVRSFLYLTGAKGHFVKLRVTLRGSGQSNSAAREFADTIASAIWTH